MLEITQITRNFAPSFWSIILVKLRNFLRHSLWRYVFGSAVLTAGIQISRQRNLFSGETLGYFVVAFLAIVAISLLSILVSSLLLAKALKSDKIVVTFRENEILVQRANDIEPEIKSWDWVISSEETGRFYFLAVKKMPRYEIVISKSRLSDEENEQLKRWLLKNNKVPR